jgi:hypothetical protein
VPHDVVPDEQYHHDDVNTSRVTTDPYQTHRSQSPVRRQPRSPGSGFDTTNVQSPDPRRSTMPRDKIDTLPVHHVGHEVPIESENSSQFKQSPPSPEHWPRNAKRDNDGAGLDKSWMLTLPDNAVRAITHGLWGRKEQRTKDGLVHDGLRGRTSRDDLRGQPGQDHFRGQSTCGHLRGQPTRRQNVTHDWDSPEPCRNNDPVGPIFEFDRRRFESNPREQRTRRHESPIGGAQRTASQRRRSPSPYLQKEGTNRDVNKSPPTDNEETLRTRYFGADYAKRGQAQSSNQAVRTPYSISQVDAPTRTIVRDRVNAWGIDVPWRP